MWRRQAAMALLSSIPALALPAQARRPVPEATRPLPEAGSTSRPTSGAQPIPGPRLPPGKAGAAPGAAGPVSGARPGDLAGAARADAFAGSRSDSTPGLAAIRSSAVIVSGVLPVARAAEGRVLPSRPRPDLSRLLRSIALGDGGLRAPERAADASSRRTPKRGGTSPRTRARPRPRTRIALRGALGEIFTPGGIRVRAKAAGVKLDFPSGGELLVSPRGAVHLRDGSATLPAPRGLELWLADGTRIVALPGSGRDDPFDAVEVHAVAAARRGAPPAPRLLWRGNRRAATAARRRPRLGLGYLVLGDGEVLYRATPLGPLLVLERQLCPRRLAADYPVERVVVLGDLLAESLVALPATLPPKPVQFPQAPEATARLAGLAKRWFTPGLRLRPAGVGAMVFPLDQAFRLTVAHDDVRGTVLAVRHRESEVPVVEWTVGMRTELHLLRPAGGRGGGPRYYLRGLDLSRAVDSVWPTRPTAIAVERACECLRRCGARPLTEKRVLDRRRR